MHLKAIPDTRGLVSRLTLVAALGAATGIHADEPVSGERIVLIGNGLAHRMQYFPHFETQLQKQFPNARFVMRNLARPDKAHRRMGQFPSPDEWLSELGADTIFAFFGFNESFDGQPGLENFRAELSAFIEHTLSQTYNGESSPRLILVSCHTSLPDPVRGPVGHPAASGRSPRKCAIVGICGVDRRARE